MANRTTPVITHTEILCLAIQAIGQKMHEYDEMVDKSDSIVAKEMTAELRDSHAAIYAPKLAALKELYLIETGTAYD